MEVINAYSVNDAYWKGMRMLGDRGIRRDSRNGPVLEMPTPVTTVYHHPVKRVLFDPNRDANPFFHLMESLWMLAGRNDVAFVAGYAKQMRAYSDDGMILNGAYGHRWRNWFSYDQLPRIIRLLKDDPDTRRAVLQMWDPSDMVNTWSQDLPCNTCIYFKIRGGKLQMTVCCRSNDIIWGTYGANAVHMSVLQEYIAAAVDIPVGQYSQVSDSYHAYVGLFEKKTPEPLNDPYYMKNLEHYPMVQDAGNWMTDLDNFLDDRIWKVKENFHNPFFHDVALPMQFSWSQHRRGEKKEALYFAGEIAAPDWRLACTQWLERRYA